MSDINPIEQDTIVAPATPPGQGGIAVVRLSGPSSLVIAQHIANCVAKPRQAQYLALRDEKKQLIDQAVVLYFQAPHSFTGEDVVEFQCHGGMVIINRLVAACIAAGSRFARPGEFSERAFLNQKIDLIQAEAIADLIAAGSVQASQAALRSLQGEFSQRVHSLQLKLGQLRMQLEASIDFSDQDIDLLESYGVADKLVALQQQTEQLLSNAQKGQKLQHGVTVVLAGPPNAGKSTLLNQLAKQEVAIVTEIAGTTRDRITSSISIHGLPVHLIDTAGLRESTDRIEQEGIKRTLEAIRQADLIIWLCDLALGKEAVEEEYKAALAWRAQLEVSDIATFFIGNKIDRISGNSCDQSIARPDGAKDNDIQVEPLISDQPADLSLLQQWLPAPPASIQYKHIAAVSGYGLESLEQAIWQQAGLQQADSAGTLSARQRHLQALTKVLAFVQQAYVQYQQHSGVELIAEELRLAQRELSELTGEHTTDDLLGDIFSSFCIGK